MIKYIRFVILFLFSVFALAAKAQVSTATTSSPYSRYGLGDLSPVLLPQNDAMGGIATAINRISGYNNINPLNPASYGLINYTTIDAGLYSTIQTFNQTGQAGSTNANFRASHVVFAIPVTKRSALSFGLLPYSEVGYNYKQVSGRGFGTGSPADTNVVNNIYNGDGGLSKAYFGYGYHFGKHLLLGANVSYIFGNIENYTSTEIPTLYGFLNPRVEQSNSVGGINYDYGVQYSFDFGESLTKHLVLGYSASAAGNINSTESKIVSQYTYDNSGNENIPADSLQNLQSSKNKIRLPQINHFGISFQSDGQFIVGADYTMGKWSSLTIDGSNAGLQVQDSKTFNVGGQFTPDINALHNYFARTDYRLGFKYDEGYVYLNNTTIKTYALTFGLGLPLVPNTGSFYKINLSGEIGKTGTLANNLVKENYVTIHLGFTLNDKWFQRFKFQ